MGRNFHFNLENSVRFKIAKHKIIMACMQQRINVPDYMRPVYTTVSGPSYKHICMKRQALVQNIITDFFSVIWKLSHYASEISSGVRAFEMGIWGDDGWRWTQKCTGLWRLLRADNNEKQSNFVELKGRNLLEWNLKLSGYIRLALAILGKIVCLLTIVMC